MQDISDAPNSPFVADFLGATNVCDVTLTRDDDGLRIEAGPDNTAARLAVAQSARLAVFAGGPAVGYFHVNAARLGPAQGEDVDGGEDGMLTLFGRITQISYPGGFHRYAVTVGRRDYVVDADRRLSDGDAVGIHLPVDAIHLYPAVNNQ